MNQELLSGLCDLKELIINTIEYKNLEISEKEMENSDEVKVLSYKKDVALMEFEDAKKYFDENSNEVLKKQIALSEAINNLNSHPLVKKYNNDLAIFNKLLSDISEILFRGIKDA